MSPNLKSRRAVLASALGAAGAATATALAGPASVSAANGDTVKVGQEHTGTTRTLIENTTMSAGEVGFVGKASGVGVLGESVSGQGVIGRSSYEAGVEGHSISSAGLKGFGVYGLWAEADWEGSPSHTQMTIGVFGRSFDGQGIHGETTTGIGGYFTATTGTALDVAGRAKFSRSGRATIKAGRSYADVNVTTLGGLIGTPLCFANLQRYRPGVLVAAVRPNYPSGGQMRIYLNKAVTSSITVAWVVLG